MVLIKDSASPEEMSLVLCLSPVTTAMMVVNIREQCHVSGKFQVTFKGERHIAKDISMGEVLFPVYVKITAEGK